MPLIALGSRVVGVPGAELPQAPTPSAWQGLRMLWRAANGEEFDLLGRSGMVLANKGVEGLHMPKIDYWDSDSPARHGAMVRGWRTPMREAYWPLFIWSDISSDEWLDRDRRFWATMHPDQPGWWRVITPGGGWRELQLRFASDDTSPELDPVKFGWLLYGITLRADWPFWQGAEVRQSFAPPTQRNFFGGGALPVTAWEQRGAATPFWISASTSVIDTSITNPGDLPAWPTWRVHGPFSEVGIIVDGHELHWPDAPDFASSDQDSGLLISTDPNAPSVRAFSPSGIGENLIHRLDRRDFAPIPARATTRFQITLDGAGWVEASFRPNYLRAW